MKRKFRIAIKPPTVIFFVLLVLLDQSTLSLIPILAALCHEFGHVAMMCAVGMKVREVEITVFGAEIRTPPSEHGTLASVAVYAAGGAANIVSAIAVTLLPLKNTHTEFFAACSLCLAIINLLPIRSLDGGCILEAILIRLAPTCAYSAVSAVSAVVLMMLWLAAVYLLLVCGGNLSLMLFCMYLFAQLFL